MRYISTRGNTAPMAFQDAVLTGLAPDGGLLLPETVPDVSALLPAWRQLTFAELAVEVLGLYADDIPREDLAGLVRRSYASFDHATVTPLVPVGDLQVLELFHGPTLAFKDVALQLLGNLFEYVLQRRGERLNILGATSGDTGSAAIAGVRGREAMEIFIMFPAGRTSALQERQMTTVLDANVHNIAVQGSFDDCQRIMKTLFADLPFKREMHLGAVNSVNWARVLAQVVYYFHAGLHLGGGERPVSFCVPTGNFGNIFAGWLAARMGLPVERLVLASNENDILAVFFDSGRYRCGAVHYTVSPSMDIQVASNFERFLYYRLGEDAQALTQAMQTFTDTGELQVDDGQPMDARICARSVDTAETLRTLRRVWLDHGYLLDPHTAVAYAAAEALRGECPMICLATAHPAKFPDVVERALGLDVARHPRLQALHNLPVRCDSLPADLDAVRNYLRQRVRG